MNNHFEHAKEYDTDCFVADYNEQTHNERGVELSENPFNDISYFHLSNPNNIHYWGINFEEHKSFFVIDGVEQSNCECMFVSKQSEGKKWACLVEMKYCNDKRLARRAHKAYNQLKLTFDLLESRYVLNASDYRIYLNISAPDHSNREPFSNFVLTPAERLQLRREKGIQILGYNELLIATPEYIFVPESTI